MRCLLAFILASLLAFPAMANAALPKRVTVRVLSNLDWVLSLAEDTAAAQPGLSPTEVHGVTLRLKDFLEDEVLMAGKTVDVHPQAIVDAITRNLKQGVDKRTVAMKLVQMERDGKL